MALTVEKTNLLILLSRVLKGYVVTIWVTFSSAVPSIHRTSWHFSNFLGFFELPGIFGLKINSLLLLTNKYILAFQIA